MNRHSQIVKCPLRLWIATCFALILISSNANELDALYDEDKSTDIETILPPAFLKGGEYEFDESAEQDNLFYKFSVNTNFGRLQVASIAMLRRRLGEITKLDEIQRLRVAQEDVGEFISYSEDDVFSDALGTAWRIRRTTQAQLDETKTTEPPTPKPAADDDFPTVQWRTAAARLGLDPYSSFPPVQKALQLLSKELGSSRFPNNVSSVAATRVFEARFPIDDNFEFETVSVIKNSSVSELRTRTAELLISADIALAARAQFMNNEGYTESDRFRFARLLQSLTKLDAKTLLVSSASTADTEVDGLAFLNYLRLASAYNNRVEPLNSILGITRYPALVSEGKTGLLALPIDYLPWNERTAKLAEALIASRDEMELRGFTVVILGKPTELARAKLNEMGVKLIEGISL